MTITINQPLSYSHIGQKPNQEDCVYPQAKAATPQHRFFILCDGMGGHSHGEVASRIVCETLGAFFESHPLEDGYLEESLFKQGLSKAYDALDEYDDGESFRKMGTTLAFVCFHRGGCFTAHLGDSRIYQIRPGRGVVFQSIDHSLVNELLQIGEISEEEAVNYPHKNIITRAMQPHLEQRYKAEIHQLTDLQKGDYFFLCSDGVLEQLTNEALVSVLSDNSLSDGQKMKALEEISIGKTHDNFTAWLIGVDQVA